MITSLLQRHQRVEPEASRADLILALRSALKLGKGFAAGKLGLSEQALLLYPTLLERCHTPQQRLALTPADPPTLRRADGPVSQHPGGHALLSSVTRESHP